jgi:hypothetical protein
MLQKHTSFGASQDYAEKSQIIDKKVFGKKRKIENYLSLQVAYGS